MSDQPLAEVFGFPIDNTSEEAIRHRKYRLCPFHNRVPNCTKSNAENPLGVCSVFDASGAITATCPVRFRENWGIITDAARFFFPESALWTTLTEVSLKDKFGKSAGNIDIVLISYDSVGRVLNYGALEVQAVYISGNVSIPFAHFMESPETRGAMSWRGQRNYPRPDFLSSSRKRLAPQLIFKGGILHAWKRKMAVAVDLSFFETLPELDSVSPEEGELVWLIYDFRRDEVSGRVHQKLVQAIYTRFESALLKITRSEPGEELLFLNQLEASLKRKLSDGS
jgi:hypothetical protein